MEYPDEEYPSELDNVGMGVNEINDSFGVFKENNVPNFGVDIEQKLNQMLGIEDNANTDMTPLFERGDKLLSDIPLIDTEAKIRQMLG